MTSHWFSIVTLLAAMIIGYGAVTSRNANETAAPEHAVVLGYYLKNAIITETSSNGTPHIRFAADDVVQNPKDNSVSLNAVRIDYLWSKDAKPNAKQTGVAQMPIVQPNVEPVVQHWVLNANRAQVPPKSRQHAQQITLTGDVEAHSVGGVHETALSTQLLNLDTVKQVAQSPQVVNVNVDGHTLTGHGLLVDLKKQHVHLQSDVQIHLAKNARPAPTIDHDISNVSLPGVFYSESSDYRDNVLVLNKVRSKVEPLIQADQARASGADLANNQIVLRGAVHLELPQKGQLNADTATVTVQESRIGHVHVSGTPVKFEHQAQNSQKIARGHAKTIDYDVVGQRLRFNGDAWFSDGDIQLTAEKIDYDIGTGHAHGDRSTIIFNPRNLANDAGATKSQ